MFGKKKNTAKQMDEAFEKLKAVYGSVERVDDVPVKEYMVKWLSAFAPDMPVYDAKSFCLPKNRYKNYLWHAFSFQKTDSLFDVDAIEEFVSGFEGECFVLLNEENLLCTVPDGRVFDPENVKDFNNVIIFTKDFTETYVYTGKEGFGPYYKSKAMTETDDSEPIEDFEEPLCEESAEEADEE